MQYDSPMKAFDLYLPSFDTGLSTEGKVLLCKH